MYREDFIISSKLFAVKLIHFLISVMLFFGCWIIFRYERFPDDVDFYDRYNYYVNIAYGVILLLFSRTYNTYLFGYSRIRTLVFAQFLAQFFSIAVIYFIVSISWNNFKSPLALLLLLAVQLFTNCIISYFGSGYFFKLNPPKNTILIYRNKLDRHRFGYIKGKPAGRLYRITKELMYDGTFHELEPQLKGFEAVFVAGVNSRCRNGILKYCKESNIPGFFLPHVGDVIMQEAFHIQSFDSPVLYAERKKLSPEYAALKRGFDIIFSALGIVILSPVMAVTAIAIKLYDRGPVFYRQVRMTKDGRLFKIVKFRSMRVDAEKDGVARLSTGDADDRITPIGRVVRRFRIDEIPQLYNILAGHMSIVGPRPERPEIAEKYYKTMPDFKLRLQIKAGLTGYAQVYGKYNTDPYEKLEFDLLYIRKMSVLTDLELMFATVGILFSKESTEGVGGRKTAVNEDFISDFFG